MLKWRGWYDVYDDIEECNPKEGCKIAVLFGDMIADMLSNKKVNSIVTELFSSSRKLNISLVFITQSYFVVLSSTYYFMKISNKQELQQIIFNYWSDIEFEDFMNLYQRCPT